MWRYSLTSGPALLCMAKQECKQARSVLRTSFATNGWAQKKKAAARRGSGLVSRHSRLGLALGFLVLVRCIGSFGRLAFRFGRSVAFVLSWRSELFGGDWRSVFLEHLLEHVDALGLKVGLFGGPGDVDLDQHLDFRVKRDLHFVQTDRLD